MNVRSDFPIFTTHPNLVYLDSAATSQKPQVVLDAVMDYYKKYNANIHRGLYPIAAEATAKVEEVREKVRKFINARYSEEIIFTHGTTESVNIVSQSWGKDNIMEGDEIVLPVSEHHAIFVPWQQLAKKQRASFTVVNSLEDIPIRENIKLLTFSHISNVLGTVNPIQEIVNSQKVKNKDLKVFVDAAQSASHVNIDVQEMDCDFLAFSGHKMFAETGIGVLYIKKEILEAMPPYLFGGDMIREVTIEKTTFADIPQKFEAGTLNISGIISLGAAIDYIDTIGFENIQKHEKQLIDYCLSQMEKIDGLQVIGSENSEERSGLLSFIIDDIHPHDIAQVLGDNNICIRAGHHCAMPLHTALGIPASARVSFSAYNTREDIDKLIAGIKEVKEVFQ